MSENITRRLRFDDLGNLNATLEDDLSEDKHVDPELDENDM